MNRIIVYGEIKNNDIANSTLELISKAYELKIQALSEFSCNVSIETVLIAEELNDNTKQKIYSSGSDKVTLIKYFSAYNHSQTIYSKVFVDYFNQNPADAILFPATQKIRTIAPRITTMLDTGLVADCTNLELISKNGEIKLASTRPTFGGELMATILSKKNPQCATIRPGTFKIKEFYNGANEYSEFIPPLYEEDRLKVLKTLINDNISLSSLENAKIILAGGFGLVSKDKKEYFEKLEKLARMMNVSVGCTRKVVDYGIMPSSSQIGQTGITVSPELYIAFGISGAIQHITGMKNAKKVIAINSDENAEIFKYADYKIVKDAKELIDELIGALSL